MAEFRYYTDKNGIRHCNKVVNTEKIKKPVYVIILNSIRVEFESINQCCKAFNLSYSAMKQLIKSCDKDRPIDKVIRFSHEDDDVCNFYIDVEWEDDMLDLMMFIDDIYIRKDLKGGNHRLIQDECRYQRAKGLIEWEQVY